MVEHLDVDTPGRGLHEITAKVREIVAKAGFDAGLCTVFVRHTSASLVIQENADPSARHDLESWQGIYLWEHRPRGSRREVVLHVGP
jgi:thiamine phosphate synthase YjbQ (UPF0047 family)